MGRGRPKGSGGINKSEKIREYLVSNPDASTNMIVEALGSFGVSAALVGGVRSRMNGEVGSKKKSVAAAVNSEDMASLHSIVKTFADADVVLDLISDIIKLMLALRSWARWLRSIRVSLLAVTLWLRQMLLLLTMRMRMKTRMKTKMMMSDYIII